ncbi:MAG: carbon monoxide dehydrogenase, partial [Rhodobacteraceae bacterium]|nr:carbon monoxide dehydrogenase [Paracoccaceae bacterium]
MYDFALQRPQSLNEAIEALSAEGAQALAGGQTLIPTLKNRLASPDVLVSIGGLSELQGVSETDGTVSIKAGTTHGVVAATVESYPALASLAGNIGDPAVRNRGTIGGSLANNDPSACYPAAALASNASITTNKRTISASDFFAG